MVLLTGATGYVGGRLVKRLTEKGCRIRCLCRNPEALSRLCVSGVETVQGDVMDPASLRTAMDGVRHCYYLIHSMGAGEDFEERDRIGARNFAQAAAESGVERIIYLGGLANAEGELSSHLRSRIEVGNILRSTGIPVVEFRASVIIGSGSLSFELVRALVEKLPAMVTPRWVSVPAQPIAVEDVLSYLAAALDLPDTKSRTYEIGGADIVTYGGLMREYARQRGLRRLIVPVPLLTPRLSSLWLGLVTPIYARVGRKLIDSMRHPSLVKDFSALADFAIRPLGCSDAVAAALRNEDRELAETRWSDAVSSAAMKPVAFGRRFGNRLIDSRTIHAAVSAEVAFRQILRIGGEHGWYFADWLWRLRGAMDLLAGGVGMRRGRRHPQSLAVGDAVDWWRVEAFESGRLLRLSAEMKLPGRAWLQFEVAEVEGSCTISQTAIFDPIGLAGLAYWYGVYPLHALVFKGMLREIAQRATKEGQGGYAST